MKQFIPQKIFVEQSARELPLTRQILNRCGDIPDETVADVKELIRSFNKKMVAGFDGKKVLLLCRNKGRFLEPCPGTKKHLCCCYAILNVGTGCPLDCSYCVLQAYLNNPFITLYVNRQDMLDELEAAPALLNGGLLRIGTGEYMDSLALEHLTDFSAFIPAFLKKRPGVVMELKTKTTRIESLLEHDHSDSFIVSWSLNADDIADKEEVGAAPVKSRIEAALALIKKGYRVGFHFDPIIFYPGWENGYKKVIALLAEYIPPASIAWISLGSLRYMPQLKHIGQKRFPDTKIFSQEFIPGFDGKMRYLKDIRVEMYSKIVSWLKAYSEDFFLYFCMESPAIWKKILGFAPSSNAELKKLLDRQVIPTSLNIPK